MHTCHARAHMPCTHTHAMYAHTCYPRAHMPSTYAHAMHMHTPMQDVLLNGISVVFILSVSNADRHRPTTHALSAPTPKASRAPHSCAQFDDELTDVFVSGRRRSDIVASLGEVAKTAVPSRMIQVQSCAFLALCILSLGIGVQVLPMRRHICMLVRLRMCHVGTLMWLMWGVARRSVVRSRRVGRRADVPRDWDVHAHAHGQSFSAQACDHCVRTCHATCAWRLYTVCKRMWPYVTTCVCPPGDAIAILLRCATMDVHSDGHRIYGLRREPS